MFKEKKHDIMNRIVVIILISFLYLLPINLSAQSRTPFTDINAIIDYLEESRGTLANPVFLPVRINLGNMTQTDSGWMRLLDEIHNSGKAIALDLSACTMNGTEFNPVDNISIGKANIVSIILPNVAQSIRDGTNESYGPIRSTFNHFTELKEVSGSNITYIGSRAFNGTDIGGAITRNFPPNTKLINVNFPRAASIGGYAFMKCTSLTNVNIPIATSIGSGVFSGCTSLVTVNFPLVTDISEFAFSDCTSLPTVNFPAATSIGRGAFSGCTSLVSINFPLVTSIFGNTNQVYSEAGAFKGCISLESVIFPEVTFIGPEAFSGCTNLKSVNFPKVTDINGVNSFYGCTSLESINIPLVATIGNTQYRSATPHGSTFAGCTNLVSVNLPRVTWIGINTFSGCIKLANLNMPRVTNIDNNAFQNTGSAPLIITLGGGAPSLGTNLFNGVTSAKTVTVRRPEGVIGWAGDLPFNNLDTSNNWGNAFRGRGWSRNSSSYGTGTVNNNIMLIIEEI